MSVVIANDPRGDFSEQHVVALRGPTNTILNQVSVSLANTGGQVTWTSPNPQSLVARRVRFKATINGVINWTAAAATTLAVAPRQYPFHQILQSLTTSYNNMPVGGQTFGEFALPVVRYMGEAVEDAMVSTATLPDYYTEYSTASSYCPYNVQGDGSVVKKGRAGCAGFTLTGAVASGAGAIATTFTMNVDEVLLFGGAYTLNEAAPWLSHINKLTWNFIISTQLAKLVSITPNANASAITVSANGALFTNAMLLLESA